MYSANAEDFHRPRVCIKESLKPVWAAVNSKTMAGKARIINSNRLQCLPQRLDQSWCCAIVKDEERAWCRGPDGQIS